MEEISRLAQRGTFVTRGLYSIVKQQCLPLTRGLSPLLNRSTRHPPASAYNRNNRISRDIKNPGNWFNNSVESPSVPNFCCVRRGNNAFSMQKLGNYFKDLEVAITLTCRLVECRRDHQQVLQSLYRHLFWCGLSFAEKRGRREHHPSEPKTAMLLYTWILCEAFLFDGQAQRRSEPRRQVGPVKEDPQHYDTGDAVTVDGRVTIIIQALITDHESHREDFNGLPFLRIFISLFNGLTCEDPALDPIATEILEYFGYVSKHPAIQHN